MNENGHTVEELELRVKQLLMEQEQLKAAQRESEELMLAEIRALRKEVFELRNDVIPPLQQKISEIDEKQRIFTMHINQLYNSQDIEHTIKAMAAIGKSELSCESCEVYMIDPSMHKMFTYTEAGDKKLIDVTEGSFIEKAARFGEATLDNNYSSADIGDGKSNMGIRNAAVIPIESGDGQLYGVVVAKNKSEDFTRDDVKSFSLEDGKIGSAFRVGFENKYLKQLAITDNLTKIHNRQGLEDYLKHTVYDSLQEGKPVSAIIMDIDLFKRFNDIYGHDVGDAVLKKVAQAISDNIRPTDEVARWGGEEIVVISQANEQDTYLLAERLRQIISETPLDIGDKQVFITASMGIAQFNPQDYVTTPPEKMLQRFESRTLKSADERLYEAKDAGRNTVIASPSVMPFDKSDYEVLSYQHLEGLESISSPLLLEDGTPVAELMIHSASGMTGNITLVVEGTPEIYYGGEYFAHPNEYTEDLRALIDSERLDDMQIISENCVNAHIQIADENGVVVIDVSEKWEKDNFTDYKPEQLRDLILDSGIEHIRESERQKTSPAKSADEEKKTQSITKKPAERV